MKKLYGVVVPIVTPLTQEDAIDVTSLKRLADHCIDSGMQAIYMRNHGRDDVSVG